MARIVVLTVYVAGFWVVAAIIAAQTGNVPPELFLAFSVMLGALLSWFKTDDTKPPGSDSKEKS